VLIVGTLNREPPAPYLDIGYDPWAGGTGAAFTPAGSTSTEAPTR